MQRIRIGVIGAGALSEWGVLPTLVGPDALAPPDDGAWWSRRPVAEGAIRWQAPARPEVIALCDGDGERAARLARSTRTPAHYAHWRAMLAETELDALFCENSFCENATGKSTSDEICELIAAMPSRGAKFLWLGGAPSASSRDAMELTYWAGAHNVRLWPARPLRRAAAHRAAIQLIKRGEIGDVTGLCLRWSAPFAAAAASDAALHASSLGALDLLLACAGAAPLSVSGSATKGTSHLWLQFTGGASASALFASSDNWNAPLPRLEICGTQGRFLVCEAGRRMWFYQPHEAARLIEPPGIAAHVSSANIAGLAEDIKAFLAFCAQEKSHEKSYEKSQENSASLQSAAERDWMEAARSLATLEAAALALSSGETVAIEAPRWASERRSEQREEPPERSLRSVAERTVPLKLPLSL